ncbi:GPALPP motifs-containing protein 1 [Neosynchiropus ocellatus]
MSSDQFVGPVLPPAFKRKSDDDSEDDFAGPALPPGYKRTEPSSTSDDSEPEVSFKRAKTSHDTGGSDGAGVKDEDDGFFGPALPPGFKKKQCSPERPPFLGPALPPGFRKAAYEDNSDDENDEGGFSGPALPPGYQVEPATSEDEEDVIGPLPAKGPVQDSVALDIERRAKKMKEKLTGQDVPEVQTRDTWMTELPPELQHIGLGARTFKKRSGPEKGDRSIWTDTPADRERKAREYQEKKKKGEVEKETVPQVSEKELKIADKETKRSESLMSLHAKSMKEKAKEKAGEPAERRAFDRDTDLQVNRFDEAQKKQLLKKSQDLNTRFSHSRDKMFL